MTAGRQLDPRATSLLRYAPGLVVLVIVIADSGQMTDTDLWGHIRFGQAVIAQRHLILRDPYSYTAFGQQWSNHEWLTEVVMAAAYNAIGVVGLKLWKFACVAATMLMVAMGLAETGASPSVQLNTFTLVAIATMPQMEFRPQLFTFMFLAAMLALLARHNYRGLAPLWLLFPMMALWANLHGGFIMGIVVIAIYAGVTAIEDLIRGAGLSLGLRLGALATAGLIATMITPYGLETWSPVFHALRNPMTRIAVTDWQPLAFAIIRQWHANPAGVIYLLCGVGMLLAFVITFALEPRGGGLPLTVIAAVMSIAAIVAVRNLPLAIIACALPVARHSAALLDRKRSHRGAAETHAQVEVSNSDRETIGVGAGFDPSYQRSATSPWLALAVAVMLAIYSGLFSSRLRDDKPYPIGAVTFMRDHDLRGNILGDFGWGEYLIWHVAPASKVFIDGRYDTVYPYGIIDQYINFYFDRGDAKTILSAYPHDFVLIPSASRAFALMQRQPGWKLIYRDADSALFARYGSPASRILPTSDVPVASVPKAAYFP
jgi:hypothetical protein